MAVEGDGGGDTNYLTFTFPDHPLCAESQKNAKWLTGEKRSGKGFSPTSVEARASSMEEGPVRNFLLKIQSC